MMKQKIIILDYSTGITYVANYDSNKYSVPDYFDKLNEEHDICLKESQCAWMITDDELNMVVL